MNNGTTKGNCQFPLGKWNCRPARAKSSKELGDKKMGKSLLLLVVFPACGLALDAPHISENARVVYEGSDELPDSLAFVSTMQILATMNDIDDASPALDLIQRGMELSSAEARDVLDHILLAFEAFSDDRNAYTEEVLCPRDRTPPNGTEIYQVFEAIDDADEWLGAKHLQALKAELGDDKAARLQQWLQSRKYNITYVKDRHKARYEQAGLNPEVARDRICSRVADEAR